MKILKTTMWLTKEIFGTEIISVKDGIEMGNLIKKAFKLPKDGTPIKTKVTIFKKGKIIIEKED